MIQKAPEPPDSDGTGEDDGEVVEVITETVAIFVKSPMVGADDKGSSGSEGGTTG